MTIETLIDFIFRQMGESHAIHSLTLDTKLAILDEDGSRYEVCLEYDYESDRLLIKAVDKIQ